MLLLIGALGIAVSLDHTTVQLFVQPAVVPMLRRSEKAKIIEGLQERFGRQKVSIFTDFRGINVGKLSLFRRELKKIGAEFKVAKKTFLKRALNALGIGLDPEELEGEIGVIFGYGDQVAPAKTAAKFAKENDTFKVLRGVLDGKVIEGKAVLALAKLPSRGELLGQVASVLQAPIRNLAVVLQANVRNLAVVLIRVKETRHE